jgi:hypothetical protein
LSTRDTDATDTSAARATSRMVAFAMRLSVHSLRHRAHRGESDGRLPFALDVTGYKNLQRASTTDSNDRI